MNLWIRLLWLFATARRRGKLLLPHDASILTFRVWPHDLDVSMHMNNGRYLTLMDLGRIDIMLRSGLWREVIRQKWTPIASTITIRFRRELTPFQKFSLETRLVCWDATHVVIEQIFVVAAGTRDSQVATRALFKGGLYDRKTKSFVAISCLMRTLGISAASPTASAEVTAFLAASDALRQSSPNQPVSSP